MGLRTEDRRCQHGDGAGDTQVGDRARPAWRQGWGHPKWGQGTAGREMGLRTGDRRWGRGWGDPGTPRLGTGHIQHGDRVGDRAGDIQMGTGHVQHGDRVGDGVGDTQMGTGHGQHGDGTENRGRAMSAWGRGWGHPAGLHTPQHRGLRAASPPPPPLPPRRPAASTDSASLLTSDAAELPADSSSPSEDSCLLEAPGSARSVDYVLFRSIQRSRADYCLSVDCVRCSHHGRGPRGPFEDPPRPRSRGGRSFSCSTAEPRGDGALPGGAATHSCNRLEGLARGGGGPCLPEVRLRGGRGRGGGGGTGGTGAGRPCQARRNSEASCPPSPAPALGSRPLLRSHSDPGAAMLRDNGTGGEKWGGEGGGNGGEGGENPP